MGYKLARFDVVGNVEIDPRVNSCYIENLNPKFNYCMDIREFREFEELPAELYELDILDGSPPCSLFSGANMVADEKKGKEVKFREGQTTQVLDDLFFEFIALAKRLQPKVVVAENVKLDGSNMGVPQKRRRVFFMAIRKDLQFDTVDLFGAEPRIDLDFKDEKIPFKKVYTQSGNNYFLSDFYKDIWSHRLQGDKDFSCTNARYRNKPNTGFGQNYVYMNGVCNTLTAKKDVIVLFDEPRYLNDDERVKIGTFPKDYNFLDQPPHYLIGMSVPPLMTYKIAMEIKKQWLDKNKNRLAA